MSKAVLRGIILVLLTAVGCSVVGAAEIYPTRPITMVIPFAAGGPADILGRVLATRMSEVLGQQVIIENPGGAGGIIGTARVAKAVPDGYQFVIGTVGSFAQNQTLYRKPAYDSQKDFAPVGLISEAPLVVIARNDFPAKDLKEFVSYAKSRAGQLSYGSAGAGSAVHLGCVLFNTAMGIRDVHVPYRGTSIAMQDLQGGRLDYLCEIITAAKGQIDSGAVKAIAIMDRQRSAALPNLQTTVEQGLLGAEAYTWWGFFVPKGTPESIVQTLNQALGKAMDDPIVQERMAQLGATIVSPPRRSPEYLATFLKAEIEKWAAPIKDAGVVLE